MQIYARDHVEVHPQKKKEVLYLAQKQTNNAPSVWKRWMIMMNVR